MKKLNPAYQDLISYFENRNQPQLWQLPLSVARETFNQLSQNLCLEPPKINCVENRNVPGPGGAIPLRIYYPPENKSNHSLPVLVYFHGGAWIMGNLDSHESVCKNFCNDGNCIVVAVDYRLAPENKFPAPVEDAYAATYWVANNASSIGGNPKKIIVGGDSAGGTLAAVVAQLAKNKGFPELKFQMLLYPLIYFNSLFPSRKNFGQGYFLTTDFLDWCTNHYLASNKDALDHRASPGLFKDLSGLPPTLIITAGFDPLVDEGHDYANKLNEAGVDTEYICYEDMIHGFILSSRISDGGKKALAQCSKTLKEVAAKN